MLIPCLAAPRAEGQFYVGAMGGLSTLSGDARSVIGATSTSFASYSPQNGMAVNALVGKHLTDFLTVQGDYVWNRNALSFSAAGFNSGSIAQYEETRSSSQHSAFGSVLVYFRRRKSRIRPYLSVGAGWVHLTSTEETLTTVQGGPALPPHKFTADMVALRVPVGIDVTLHDGWRFRYSFSETLSKNPISDELSPPGPHSLKNFQNLFGIIYRF